MRKKHETKISYLNTEIKNIKIKINHANFFKNVVRTSEYSSKWIVICGILEENTKPNYIGKNGSLMKTKNHVNIYLYEFEHYLCYEYFTITIS